MSPGKFNNYLIGGNLCNAFALGEIGSMDNFFLVGSEPSEESNYPMITGNLLDSEGNVLFRLVKNVLIFNPGHCSKILGDHIGYEIHDSAGKMILRVSTKFEKTDELESETYITSIEANFYNKEKELVFKATSGSEDERIESNCKSAFGFLGGFGMVIGYNSDELEMVKLALLTQGTINQKVTGEISNTQIELDGKYVVDAKLNNCKIIIKDGDFILKNNLFNDCHFEFKDRAAQIYNIVMMLLNKNKEEKG
jgi:hypothetical protein